MKKVFGILLIAMILLSACGFGCRDGWVKDGGSWYYYDAGAIQTGWIEDNGTWYYLDETGVMQTGWIKDGGVWYYLNGSGAWTGTEWDYGFYNTGIQPVFSIDNLYAQAFWVINVQRDDNDVDLVSIQDNNGNIFQFTADGSDWCVNDGCACVMDTNGTPEIYDDIILTARYFAW